MSILIMVIEMNEVVCVIKSRSAMEVRNNLGELLNEVQYRQERIVITRASKPVAALVDMPMFERIRLLDEEFVVLTDQLARAYQEVDPATAEAEIAEALAALSKQ